MNSFETDYEINIIDTYLISYRNRLICDDPIEYVNKFLEEMRPVVSKFYLGYTQYPSRVCRELSDNLDLKYLYLLCSYEIPRYASSDYKLLCKQLINDKKFNTHLYNLNKTRAISIKFSMYYLFIATDKLLVRVPPFIPRTNRQSDVRHLEQFYEMEKKKIMVNSTIYG
jgi:hypothetical protein